MNRTNEYRVVEKHDDQGRLLERTWKSNNSDGPHRKNGPAFERYDPETGNVTAFVWVDQTQGGRHRENLQPAAVQIDPETGVVVTEEYCMWNMHHREDGGATKTLRNRSNGIIVAQEFHIDGRLHRDFDLPAVMEFHPKTGKVARLEYYQSGVLNRQNGPALVEFDSDGKVCCCQHFNNGRQLSQGSPLPAPTR